MIQLRIEPNLLMIQIIIYARDDVNENDCQNSNRSILSNL
jgi:hypothetical protein